MGGRVGWPFAPGPHPRPPSPVPRPGACCLGVYVDNVTVIGQDSHDADNGLRLACDALEKKGRMLHEPVQALSSTQLPCRKMFERLHLEF